MENMTTNSLKSVIGVLVMVLLCGACASKKEQKAYQERTHQQLDQLHVGMSFEEAKAVEGNLGNCRGSKASVMECQMVFLGAPIKSELGHALELGQAQGGCQPGATSGGGCDARPLPKSPALNSHGTIYKLVFEKNKLMRWGPAVQ